MFSPPAPNLVEWQCYPYDLTPLKPSSNIALRFQQLTVLLYYLIITPLPALELP